MPMIDRSAILNLRVCEVACVCYHEKPFPVPDHNIPSAPCFSPRRDIVAADSSRADHCHVAGYVARQVVRSTFAACAMRPLTGGTTQQMFVSGAKRAMICCAFQAEISRRPTTTHVRETGAGVVG